MKNIATLLALCLALWCQAQPFSTAALEKLDSAIRAGQYGHIDQVLVLKNDSTVFQRSYDNDYRAISRGHASILGCGWETCTDSSQLHDFNYLHPDFHPYYQGRWVHSLQSVTKSVAATLIGIALHRGELESLNLPLLSFFEDYDLINIDERLQSATLQDLLTMRTGIEWHEQDRPIDSTNTTLQLEMSGDWVQFTLDQPMDAAPGEKWAYSSGGSHLMSVRATEHP